MGQKIKIKEKQKEIEESEGTDPQNEEMYCLGGNFL